MKIDCCCFELTKWSKKTAIQLTNILNGRGVRKVRILQNITLAEQMKSTNELINWKKETIIDNLTTTETFEGIVQMDAL